jgi:hypothetical protein
MGTYKVTDPQTGRTLRLTGDSPPTEQELNEIFASQGEQPVAPVTNQPGSIPPTKDDVTGPEWSGKYPNLYGALGAAKEVARFAGETAGLVGGGILGAPLGPAGAIAGAGLGYGGVKALGRFLEGEKASLPQAALTSAKDVATGAGMEMGGQIGGKIIGGIAERMSKPVVSNLPQSTISERIEKARELGIELSPAEATGSKGLALYESMLDKSPFSTTIVNTWRELKQLNPLLKLREKLISGGGKPEQTEVLGEKIKDQVNQFLGQYKNLNDAQLNTLRNNVLKKMGSTDTYESIGKAAQERISAASGKYYENAKDLYSAVGEAVPEGSSIVPKKMKETAISLLEQESKKPPSLQNANVKKILEDLSGSKNALESEIAAYPESMQEQIRAKLEAEGASGYDWKTIQSMRSELNSRIAQTDAAMKSGQPGAKFQSSPESGIYKQLRKALDNDIESFATETGGDLKASFDLANAFYKEGKLTFNAPAIRRMLSSNPEKMVDMIFRPEGGAEIDLVSKAIGKDAFEKTLKPAFTKKLLDTGDIFSPKGLETNLGKYGDEVLAKVYSPEEVKSLKELAANGRVMLEDKLIGHPFLKTISNERPEVIVDSILGSYEKFPGSKNVLKNTLLVRSVVDKPTFDSLQREMSDRIFKLNQLTDKVQPEKLSKTIQTYEDVLKIFYKPEQVSWLKNIADTTKQMAAAEMAAKNPSGTAQNVVTWGTWGALLSNPIKGAFSGILAPKVMSKLYLSDAGRAYFTAGLKTPIGTKSGTAIATKLAELAGVEATED